MKSPLAELSASLIQRLGEHDHQLVLAESCTAGMVASSLGAVPGASSVLVGSAVVYQVSTKQKWLQIPETHFRQFNVVSGETSLAMARGILAQTPWATVAAAITGHLGPEAPQELDGIAWSTVIIKRSDSDKAVHTQKLLLDTDPVRNEESIELRHQRRVEATRRVMDLILHRINPA